MNEFNEAHYSVERHKIQFYEHCNKTIDFEKARRVSKKAELDKIIEENKATDTCLNKQKV